LICEIICSLNTNYGDFIKSFTSLKANLITGFEFQELQCLRVTQLQIFDYTIVFTKKCNCNILYTFYNMCI